MKVALVWCITVIANCVSVKYIDVNRATFSGNPNANTANAYDYYTKIRLESRQQENFRTIARRSLKRQRYDQFMANMIAKHSKAVAVTISLAAIITIIIITTVVAVGAIVQCSLCYDQFMPESTLL